MDHNFKFDVFVCNSIKDNIIANTLIKQLELDGVRISPNKMLPHSFKQKSSSPEDLTYNSRSLLLLMSKNTFSREWPTIELYTAVFRDPLNLNKSFIPVLIEDCEIKDTISKYTFINYKNKLDSEYKKILNACISGRLLEDNSIDYYLELKGHKRDVTGLRMVTDAEIIFSASIDSCLKIWKKNKEIYNDTTLFDKIGPQWSIALCEIKSLIAIGGAYGKVKIINYNTKSSIEQYESSGGIHDLYFTKNGRYLTSISDSNELCICYIGTKIPLYKVNLPFKSRCVLLAESGKFALIGSTDSHIYLLSVFENRIVDSFEGHGDEVLSLANFKDNELFISSGGDGRIIIWDLHARSIKASFEGHTDGVLALALSSDNKILVSGGYDKTVRVWNVEDGSCISILSGHRDTISSVTIDKKGQYVGSASFDSSILLWDLNSIQKDTPTNTRTVKYTNAKVLVVGESGVGKTGIAHRLVENRFVQTISSDGIWATQMKLPISDSLSSHEKEIWLWDFAGQADYKLIHQLYLDDTALSLLVFNPQSDFPFENLSQWSADIEKVLRNKMNKILVAGRCDRGGMMVSKDLIENFKQKNNFADYIETSALSGSGCEELKESIIKNIDWGTVPWTSTPFIFYELKNEIINLRNDGNILLRINELKQQLEIRRQDIIFTYEELKTVIGLLIGPGILWKLEFGNFILLKPELINSYAAALIRKVRSHKDEIGVISEEDVINGNLDYQDLVRLPIDEEQIILRALHHSMISKSICLRETTESGNLLVFPSYFKKERLELSEHPNVLISYNFSGNYLEIYSTLIVRLHHTTSFKKNILWKFAADFTSPSGKLIGIKMIKSDQNESQLLIYFEQGIPEDTKVIFIKYVDDHLRSKSSDVKRVRHYICNNCNTPVLDHNTVYKKIKEGKKDIICISCERRINFHDIIEEKFDSQKIQDEVDKLKNKATLLLDNESKELMLLGHVFSIVGEAGQIFRPTANSDWGIDGEIEFKNELGQASGSRLYVQLKHGDSYIRTKVASGDEVFILKNKRHAEYWKDHAYPVMLIIMNSKGFIRWMDVSQYLRKQDIISKEIHFEGEEFNIINILRIREKVLNL